MIPFQPGWIDVHCHFYNLAFPESGKEALTLQLEEARQAGLTGFMSSALSAREYLWHWQHPLPDMIWYAGIHPVYDQIQGNELDQLADLCEDRRICAIGEIGLDARQDNSAWQEKMLVQQLDLARSYHLPVVFHTVRRYHELYRLLKASFPEVRGFLHSFNSSREIAELFSGFNLAFSLNARLPSTECLDFIIRQGFFLLETDAPYQKPHKDTSEINQLKNLVAVAEEISRQTGCSLSEIKSRQFSNVKEIFD